MSGESQFFEAYHPPINEGNITKAIMEALNDVGL